jgi:heptose-I-phosphate ethanolaminephosphotransferase
MVKRLLKAVRSFAGWLLKPVVKEFNFFLAVWLINGSLTFGYIVGCAIFPENDIMHALRCLALGTAVAYLLTLILHLLKRRWARIAFKTLCYTVLLSLEAVYIFLTLNFDMPLGPRVLVLLAETNAKEASEFVSTYFLGAKSLWAYAATLGIIAAVVLMEWKRKWVNGLAAKRVAKVIIAAIVLPLLLWGAYLSHHYVKLARCKHSKELNQWVRDFGIDALDHLSTSFYSLCYLGVSDADIAQAVDVAQAVGSSQMTLTEPDSLNVIMVLGESYIKSHASLYGYEHNTTPNMIAERDKGNLIVFTDMVTPYNATSQVQKNFFSLNDLSQGEMWYEKPIFPTVFKHAGFNVYFWDNQRNYAKTEMFTITVNSFIYNDTIAALSYDETSNRGLSIDGNLITDFQKNSKVAPAKCNLYIFHLMGQHVHPVGRYPKKHGYDVFTADSIKRKDAFLNKDKRTYIAQYDNATLYNDDVMKRIFDLWRNKNTVVLYFSDHGDEAYDYRDHCGRGNFTVPDAQLLHCQNDVPFVVWCSDCYIAHHRELYNQLKSAAKRPGMVTDASHLLLRLAGINTPYYLPERDISSPHYKPQPRIVFDKYDYDNIINEK